MFTAKMSNTKLCSFFFFFGFCQKIMRLNQVYIHIFLFFFIWTRFGSFKFLFFFDFIRICVCDKAKHIVVLWSFIHSLPLPYCLCSFLSLLLIKYIGPLFPSFEIFEITFDLALIPSQLPFIFAFSSFSFAPYFLFIHRTILFPLFVLCLFCILTLVSTFCCYTSWILTNYCYVCWYVYLDDTNQHFQNCVTVSFIQCNK